MEREEIARKLVAFAALRKEMASLESDLREAGVDALNPGSREAVHLDGTPIGAVTRKKDTVSAKLTDPDALFAWTWERHPDKIVTDEESSHSCPECKEVHRRPSRSYVEPKFIAGLLADAKENGQAVDVKTGEVLEFITVTREPGGLMVKAEPGAWDVIREGIDWTLTLAPPPKEIES